MDPSWEFMELVEEIAGDGELHFSEIRQLAMWIKENPAAREFWPVDEFVGLLGEVLRDGKIDRPEAKQVAVLIQRVRREWARKQAADLPVAEENPSGRMVQFDPAKPRIPSIPMTFSIANPGDGVQYRVNLNGPACSCPDFASRRAKLPLGHPSRCCQHVLEAYARLRSGDGWPGWMDAFLEVGFRPTPSQNWSVLQLPNGFHLIGSASPEWGNVYVRLDGKNCRYSYNVMDQRWSYRQKPEHADALAAEILRLTDNP